MKDYTHALECYTKAIEMKPKFNFTDHRVSAYDSRAKYGNGKAYFRRAVVYEELGRNKGAIADYEKCLKLDPNNNTARKNRLRLTNPDLYKEIEALLKQADSIPKSGDCNKAVDAYSKVLELAPKNQNALFYRGMCYINTKQYKEALADFDKALELDPTDNLYKKNRQRVLDKLNK